MNISKQTLRKRKNEKIINQENLERQKKQQESINDLKFYTKFPIVLFASISAILLLSEKSSILEYFVIFLASFSTLVSLVFNISLDTPQKIQNAKDNFQKKSVIFLLVILVLAIIILIFPIMNDSKANFFVGLIFICFTLFFFTIAMLIKFIPK